MKDIAKKSSSSGGLRKAVSDKKRSKAHVHDKELTSKSTVRAFNLLGLAAAAGTISNRRSVFAQIDAMREGLSAKTIEMAAERIGLTKVEISKALVIRGRTLARRKKEAVLSPTESEKLWRLDRVATRAESVLGSRESALQWLKHPNVAIDGETPLSLLDTDIGGELVMDLLGQIEHGVFS